MRLLSSYAELRLYRDKKFMLDAPDPKKQKLNTKVTIITKDRDELYTVLNDTMFDMRYFVSFFTDKLIRMKLLNGAMVNKTQKVTDVYKEVRENVSYIRNVFLNVSQYSDKNIIFDASTRLEAISQIKFASVNTYIKQVYATLDVMHKDSRFAEYGKKYYIFKIDDVIKLDQTYLQKQKIQDITQAFIYRLFVEPETLIDWIGATIVFVNHTGIFTYVTITQELIEKGVNKQLFRYLKAMYAFNIADPVEMAQYEGDFVKETPEEEEAKSDPRQKKIDAIAAKLMPNPTTRSNLVNAAIENIVSKHVEETNAFDEALDFADLDEDEIEKAVKILAKEVNTDATTSKTKPLPKGSTSTKAKISEDGDIFDDEDEALDDLANAVNSDEADSATAEEIYKDAIDAVRKKTVDTHTEKELQKIKLLQSEFDTVKFGENERTFKELIEDFGRTQIDAPEFPVKTTNASIRRSTGQAFTKAYYEKQMDADIAQVMKFFAEKTDIKVVVVDAKKVDVSDPLNALTRYTFKLKDEFGKQHTITYDIPKLIDNKFFLLNGTKKIMTSQITPIPVVKLSSDEVHISTSHNQAYLSRFGKALDPKIELIKKFLKKLPSNSAYGITYKLGDSFDINTAYNTVIEYDDLSQSIYSIVIESEDKKNSISFVFNQHDIRIMLEDLGIAYVDKPDLIPVAISNSKEVLYINVNTGKDTKTNKFTVCDLIISAIRQYSSLDDVAGVIDRIAVPKKYMYTRIMYINQKLALGVFLGYLYGLSELIKRMGVKYEFTTEKKKSLADSKYDQNCIEFADGFLYWDINPVRHSLILNGIQSEMNCQNYTIAEMNEPEPYLDTFDELFRTRHIAKGFNDCKTFLIGAIEVQVLEHLNLPTDFLDVMLYANSLLEDNSKTDPKKMQINRIRKMELIPVFIQKSLTQAYLQYKYRYSSSKKGAISVKQNDIIQRLNDSRLLNDYDTLNPIREVECEGTLTFKGPGGCNVDDAYTLSRRAYDKSMVGVIAASSPDSGSVGITKYLAMNPRITSTRGFVKTGEDEDAKDIDFGNMGSIAELTTPFAIDHDDPKRLGFVTKESKHVIPAQHTDPLLIGNGVEKVFPFMVSNDFISIAKESGKVLFVDKKLGIAIVEYKSGMKETIDIKDRQHKNGGGGFYILNEKNFPYKEGDSFKQNDVLCSNPSYFSNVKSKSAPEYNPGTLSNVAIIMSHVTFEDSSVITERIAEKMSAEIVFCKHISLGAKSKVYNMVHVGDSIATGDPLMIFEDELDDPEINKIVNAADTSNMKGLEDIIKHIPKAKITGHIHDVKIYYTVPYDDMSESVRKIVTDYDNTIKERKKKILEYGALNPNEIITDYIGITRPNSVGKINGEHCEVGKILVEVYMKYRDYPGSGDKIVFYASMKTVIHRQLPQELAPYPLNHPERPIDAILSPISVNARQVTSIMYALYGNKLVYGLREKIRAIYDKYQKGEQSTAKKVTGESVKELMDAFDAGTFDKGYNLEQTLGVLGYSDKEILKVTGESALKEPKTKNIYICLYSPKSNGMSGSIQRLTNSEFSHASWGIDSSGNHFRSMDFTSLTDAFTKNGGLHDENLNNLEGVRDKCTAYHIYKVPVTEFEYARAVELYNNHETQNFHYSFKNLLSIAYHIFRNNDPNIKGFKESEITSQFQICSSYVLASIAQVRPSVINWLKKVDLRVSTITPSNIRSIPGVEFMFQGNAVFEFDRWKHQYEQTHGALPN